MKWTDLEKEAEAFNHILPDWKIIKDKHPLTGRKK